MVYKFLNYYGLALTLSMITCLEHNIVSAQGQSSYDSTIKALQNRLDTTTNDCTKIQTMVEMVWTLQNNDPERAIKISIEIVAISKPKNDIRGLSVGYGGIARCKYIQGKFDEAIYNYQLAIDYDEKGKNPQGLLSSLGNLGIVYENLGEYDKALDQYQKALNIAIEINNEMGMANNLNNIAVVKTHLGEIDSNPALMQEALDSYFEVYEFDKKSGDAYWTAKTLNNIGNGLNGLGVLTNNPALFDSALVYFKESIVLKTEVNDLEGLSATHDNMGVIYSQQGKADLAVDHFTKGLKIAQGRGFRYSEVSLLEHMCNHYSSQKDYKNAFEYNVMLVVAKDSLLNTEKQRTISELETKYQTEKKEKENQLLQNKIIEQQLDVTQAESEKNILMLGILFLVGISGLLVLYLRKNQQQKIARLHIDEQKLRLAASIEGEERERKRIASELHDGLGQLLSAAKLNVSSLETSEENQALTNSLQIIDSAVDEVRNISHSMMPNALISLGLIPALKEQVRLINGSNQIRLNADLMNEISLNEATAIGVYRIIQEVINNTLKYAEASEIDLSLKTSANQLEVEIKDNGKGFDLEIAKKKKGIGLNNIMSRVDFLKGHINFDSILGKGTHVRLAIPLG